MNYFKSNIKSILFTWPLELIKNEVEISEQVEVIFLFFVFLIYDKSRTVGNKPHPKLISHIIQVQLMIPHIDFDLRLTAYQSQVLYHW